LSNAALNAAFQGSASTGAARLVLLAMADEANTDGYLTAHRRSQAYLASKANTDKRTVGRAIDKLVELGEVEVIAQGLGKDQADYRLRLPGLGGVGDTPTPQSGQGAYTRVGKAPTRSGRHAHTGVGKAPTPSSPVTPVTPVTPSPPTPHGVPATQQALGLDARTTPARPTRTYARASKGWDAFFDRFWAVYPRREGPEDARQAWERALRRGADPGDMIAGAECYAADPNRDPTYTVHPARWLDGARWADDPLPPRTSAPVSRAAASIQALTGEPAPPIDYTGFWGPAPIDTTARRLGA
jgi:hypothetical protein